jgi:hypothetical protein
MPLKDWTCLQCGLESEDVIVRSKDDEKCPGCGSDQIQLKLSMHGGYYIRGNNSASERPRQAGSFKKKGGDK